VDFGEPSKITCSFVVVLSTFSTFAMMEGPGYNKSFKEYPEVDLGEPSKTTCSFVVVLSTFSTFVLMRCRVFRHQRHVAKVEVLLYKMMKVRVLILQAQIAIDQYNF